MKVIVTGSSGLIGSELVAELTRQDHQVTRLVRRPAKPDEATWDPAAGTIEARKIAANAPAILPRFGSRQLRRIVKATKRRRYPVAGFRSRGGRGIKWV